VVNDSNVNETVKNSTAFVLGGLKTTSRAADGGRSAYSIVESQFKASKSALHSGVNIITGSGSKEEFANIARASIGVRFVETKIEQVRTASKGGTEGWGAIGELTAEALMIVGGGKIAAYHEGNAIISNASKTGYKPIIAQTADDLAYLESMNAEALYMTDGSALFAKPSRAAIMEEAIHHNQMKTAGEAKFTANREFYEIEAQNKLLEIGKKEGWSKDVMDQLGRAKEHWQKAYDNKNKKP
jgi:hypothetical protein